MDKDNRPKARKTNVTGEGKGVHRRGETGFGPVGTGESLSARRPGSPGSSGSAKPSGQAAGSSGQTGRPAGQTTRPSGQTGRPAGQAARPSGQTGRPSGQAGRPSGGFGMPGGPPSAGGGYGYGQPGSGQGASGGSGQRQRRGGFNPILLIILAVIVLGGGGSLSGLLGGLFGGSGSDTALTNTTNTGNGSYSSSSNTGTFGNVSSQSTSSGQTAASSGSSSSSAGANYVKVSDNRGKLNRSVSSKARPKYTSIAGNGRDTTTILVYMCGTDLESRSGMGTSDLSEMAKASLGNSLNLLVYTGGCSRWRNNIVSSSKNQIYKVQNGGLALLEENAGTGAMTNPDTLVSFLQYGKANYPADRYDLILWDHGGGSLSGYGYDEKNARSGSMSLSALNSALAKADMKFDFVGFDACLMATVETASMLSRYADYMIASEETEPGIGWYYTNWLTNYSADPSMATLDIGKNIVDDFVSTCQRQCRGQSATLSVVDLSELQNTLGTELSAFSQDVIAKIKDGQYQSVANARYGAREFAQSTMIDQIDFVDFADRCGSSQGNALCKVLMDAVKYNQTSSNINRAYGLSVYFPYKKMSSVNTAVQTYDAIGMDDDFTDCIREFASLQLGGQLSSQTSGLPVDSLFGSLFEGMLGGSSSQSSGSYSGGMSAGDMADLFSLFMGQGGSSQSSGSTLGSLLGNYASSGSSGASGYSGSLLGSLLGGSGSSGSTASTIGSLLGSLGSSGSSSGSSFGALSSLAGLAGMDMDFFGGRSFDAQAAAEYIAAHQFDPTALTWSENENGETVLSLPDDQWDLTLDVERNIFYDDGEGYADLGFDNTFSFDDNGSLVPNMEKTWISINDQPVSYFYLGTYEHDDGSYEMRGKVPALLNGERVNLILVFDSEETEGYIAGAQPDYDREETETVSKGLIDLVPGDTLDFFCDFYNYDGEYESNYFIGEQMTVTDDMRVSDTRLGDSETFVMYRFTDIYNQHYWSQAL